MSVTLTDYGCCCASGPCSSGGYCIIILCADYAYSPMTGFCVPGNRYRTYKYVSSYCGVSDTIQWDWDPLAGEWFNTIPSNPIGTTTSGCYPDSCACTIGTDTEVQITYYQSGVVVGTITFTLSNLDNGDKYGFAPFPSNAADMQALFTAAGQGCPALTSCGCTISGGQLTWTTAGSLGAGSWSLEFDSCAGRCFPHAGSTNNMSADGNTPPNFACEGVFCGCTTGSGTGGIDGDPPGGPYSGGGTYEQAVVAVFGPPGGSVCVETYGSCGATPSCASISASGGIFYNPPNGTGVTICVPSCYGSPDFPNPCCC